MFETLSRHSEVYTIGGESHALIEHIPTLSTVARGYVSNRLTEKDANNEVSDLLHKRFTQEARKSSGIRLDDNEKFFRLLEKTPKNALRISFLNKVFPDAKFIFLVRDPRENISSIMQAWRSGRFVTYPELPNWPTSWSLLLPDGWKTLIGKPLASIAAYQYNAANQGIIDGLAKIPKERKMVLNYSALLTNTNSSIESILDFAGLRPECITDMLKDGLPLSRYTLTRPQANKWYANAELIAPHIASVLPQVEQLNSVLIGAGQEPLESDINLAKINKESDSKPLMKHYTRVPRNSPCPCGSGAKYRQCHGKLT